MEDAPRQEDLEKREDENLQTYYLRINKKLATVFHSVRLVTYDGKTIQVNLNPKAPSASSDWKLIRTSNLPGNILFIHGQRIHPPVYISSQDVVYDSEKRIITHYKGFELERLLKKRDESFEAYWKRVDGKLFEIFQSIKDIIYNGDCIEVNFKRSTSTFQKDFSIFCFTDLPCDLHALVTN